MDVEHPELEAFRHAASNSLEDRRHRDIIEQLAHGRDREMSEASSATLGPISTSREQTPKSNTIYRDEERGDKMELDGPQTPMGSEYREVDGSIVIATDFGTTFSSVAFATRGGGLRPDIEEIKNFYNDPNTLSGRPSAQVPTESWYLDKSQIEELSFDEGSSSWDFGQTHSMNNEFDLDEDLRLDNGGIADNRREINNTQSETETPSFIWGYEVHDRAAEGDAERSHYNRVARFKLLLDETEYTDTVRTDLAPILKRLRKDRIIKNDEDVIAQYLTKLFRHARQQLRQNHRIFDDTPIEHVLCVPVIWKSSALRIMQSAVEYAIEKSGLGSMDGLFLVSEPEAAAAYVLGKNRGQVQPGEAFLILDAGGGTVDATTYKVDKEEPLRLSHELTLPDGCLHGSSYLNEGFRKLLKARLQGEEQDIEHHGYTLEGLLDASTARFEKEWKRSVDVTDSNMHPVKVPLVGLQENKEKHFKRNYAVVTRHDFLKIFMPHLESIAELMKKQLTGARTAGHRVKKVVLIGGFSASPSLRKYLEKELRGLSETLGYRIVLISNLSTGEHETAVARGAILRAWNKEEGPFRIAKSSYGFEIAEEYNPHQIVAHVGVKPINSKLDGRDYVENAIEWLVVKGHEVDFHAEYSMSVYRTFAATRKFFKCEETLYVSDTCTESHYRRTHKKNKTDALEAGRVTADMTFLVTEGLIQPIQPEEGCIGKSHYKIEFELVIIIDGRNLRYEARWPIGGETRGEGKQICIAAAFRPGTK